MGVASGAVENGMAVESDVTTTTTNPVPTASVTPPWRNALTDWKFWLGIAISAVFLYLALRGQPLGATWEAIKRAQYIWIVPAVAAFFVRVFFSAWRWHALLRSSKHIPVQRIWPINVIGFMANNVLPLRAGEAVRIYQMGKQEGVPRSGILATLFVERIFDGLALLSLIVASMLFVPVTDRVRALAVTAAVIFFGALVVFGFVAFSDGLRRRFVLPLVRRLPGRFGPGMERRLEEFVQGLGSLRRGRDLATVLLTSFGAWGAELGTYLFVAQAFGINMGVAGTMLAMGVANLFTLIPSSPGYVGPFEAGLVLVMQEILKLPSDVTVAYALVTHATLYFPVTILGAFYWFRNHLTMPRTPAAPAAQQAD